MKKIFAFLIAAFLAAPVYGAPIGNPIVSVQTTVAASSLVLKTSQGYLNGFDATSAGTAGYVLFFDAASLPSNGTVTPKLCYTLPANSTLAASWLTYPVPFANGIVAAFSTTGCFTLTASATAFFSGQIQ